VHPWRSFREESAQYLNRSAAKEDFLRIRAADESLGRFSGADDLLRFLHDRSAGDTEQKNVILGALIRCAHRHPDTFSTVRTLLIAALFPALDRVFNSLLPLVPGTCLQESRLTNDIFWAVHLEIESWNFETRHRVAATLQLNVRRKVKKLYVTELTFDDVSTESADESDSGIESVLGDTGPSNENEVESPDIQKLKKALRNHPALREGDLELIVDRYTHGLSFLQIANQHGITEENARQRFHRAIARLRSIKNHRF